MHQMSTVTRTLPPLYRTCTWRKGLLVIRKIFLATLIMLGLAATPAQAVLTIALQSGTLTFGTVTLTADDQARNGTGVPVWRIDARNTTSGWNVTLQISNFTAAGGKAIAASNLRYTAVNGTLVKVGGGSQAINATNGPRETGNSGSLDVARKCITSNPNYGDGRYDWTADATQFILTVPGAALVGSYSATLTATVATGP